MSIYKQGNSIPTSISLYPRHIEVVNNAILNEGYNTPAHFIQTLVEDHDQREREIFKDFLLYLLYPFLIIFLTIMYAYATNNVWLGLFGGTLASIFWYSVYRYTLKSRGIDPRTHWKSKRKFRKKQQKEG